jgi:hypothetical protein
MAESAEDTCVCVLFYGADDKHFNLAQRVLNAPMRKLADMGASFCFGCNAIGWQTRAFLHQQMAAYFPRAFVVDSPSNVYKYPMMRRMLHDSGIDATFLLWFDHDSYFHDDLDVSNWLSRLRSQLAFCDIVGSINRSPLHEEQLDWARNNWPATADARYISFPNPSWWAAKSGVLQEKNWPPKNLGQKDGDVLLGEFVRRHELSLCHFRDGVKINVNEAGVESLVPRTVAQ